MQTRIQRFIHWNVNLCVANTPIEPAFAVFHVAEPSHLEIMAHVGLKHRGNYPAGVAYGLRFGLRGPCANAADVEVPVAVGMNAPNWIRGAKTGDNIEPIDQHYACPAITGHSDPANPLQPGWYRAEMWGTCHGSTAGPTLQPGDSVVEINADGGAADPYNHVLYKLTPAS